MSSFSGRDDEPPPNSSQPAPTEELPKEMLSMPALPEGLSEIERQKIRDLLSSLSPPQTAKASTMTSLPLAEDSQAHNSEPTVPKDPKETDANNQNKNRLCCLNCRSVVLGASSGEFVPQLPMDLPHFKVQQPGGGTTESIVEWWKVGDLMIFENVGVTNSHDGRRYLCCADCDLGPIGVEVESLYYLAVDRLSA